MYPFPEGYYAPRNAWYVAAHAGEVTRKPLGRTILEERVVLYRTESNVAVAVGGRCPHRHFPLEHGRLQGDNLVCGYHGLAFAPTGACVHIPSQDTIPAAAKIMDYPLIELGMWLFIWMGDRGKADPATLPSLASIGLDNEHLVTRELFADEVKGRYSLLNDNLLDLSHVAFLHETSIGVPDDARAEEVAELGDTCLSIRRTTRNAPSPPANAEAGLYTGPIDRVLGMDSYLPGFHVSFSQMAYPQNHREHAGQELLRVWIYHGVTPVTRNSCRYLFSIAGPSEDMLDVVAKSSRGVVNEDIFATERIEEIIQQSPAPLHELLLRADRSAVLGRRRTQALIAAELSEA